jgi:O-antigen ligase
LFIIGRFYLSKSFDREVVYAGILCAGLIASFQGLSQIKSWKDFHTVKGNMGQHNQQGMFIGAILSGLFAHLSLDKRMKKWGLWPIIFVLFITLASTFSRGAWVGVFTVFAMIFAKTVFSSRTEFKMKVFLISLAVLFLAGGGALCYKSDLFKYRLKQLKHMQLSGRENIWKKSINMVKQKPLGWGIQKTQEYNAHNQVLSFAVSSGVPSAIYFIALMAGLIFVCRGNIFSFPGMVVIFMLIHNLVEASLVGIWNNSGLFWLALGMFTGEKNG